MVEKTTKFPFPDPLGIFGSSPSIAPDKGKFLGRVDVALPDEAAATTEYAQMAAIAEQLGFPQAAMTLRGMSADENRHHSLLLEIKERVQRA
jgi:hypothetical protein